MQTHFDNFSLLEFLESDTAKNQKIDNYPGFADVERLLQGLGFLRAGMTISIGLSSV